MERKHERRIAICPPGTPGAAVARPRTWQAAQSTEYSSMSPHGQPPGSPRRLPGRLARDGRVARRQRRTQWRDAGIERGRGRQPWQDRAQAPHRLNRSIRVFGPHRPEGHTTRRALLPTDPGSSEFPYFQPFPRALEALPGSQLTGRGPKLSLVSLANDSIRPDSRRRRLAPWEQRIKMPDKERYTAGERSRPCSSLVWRGAMRVLPPRSHHRRSLMPTSTPTAATADQCAARPRAAADLERRKSVRPLLLRAKDRLKPIQAPA